MRTATNGQYDIDSRLNLEPGRLRHFRGAAVIMEITVSFARLKRPSRGRFAEFVGGKRNSESDGRRNLDRSRAGPEGQDEDCEDRRAADRGHQPDRTPLDRA